ncbi:uncharacterized protein [Spinacia oleracea]|uniref:Uncharacterized protein n=1 Tax=Spinacia oleracea TaxID=3562 RepID=A0ABM3QXK9_SPIOL|nr:uncharacterized protein LOC130463090 [Spinacia oleracea]
MRLNPKKCVFGVTTGKFLGFLIDERGIEVNPDKVQAVIDMTEGVQLPVYFVSHVLQNAELRYPPIEKFALALFMASKKPRPYFLAHKLVVYTDQPLKQPLTKLDAAGRMLKWEIELNAFDISYEPRKAIKGQSFADFIAEMTRPTFEKNVATRWTVYVDGSSTQNGYGADIICQSPEGDKYEYAMRFNFQTSNNEAEYEALLAGIKMCKAAGAQEILAFSDSQLMVSQVNGDYEARDPNMIKYMQAVHQEIEHLKSFEAKQISRTENNQADALSELASSASCDTPRHVFWEVKDRRSIEQESCAPMVAILDRSSTWMDPIITYKVDGSLPDDSSLAAKIQKKSSWFEWWNGVLYKKSFFRPLLRCVTPEKGKEILDDLHQGLCSSHIGGRALAEKALRTGYYWPTLREDAMAMAGSPSHSNHEPHSFSKWGMDLLGPYTTAPGGRRYVIVAVDYFTKWVEAEALKNIRTSDVRAFIWKNIMTLFGIPQAIVFDNGTQFETPKLKEWLADHGIHSCFASVGRPQANGQVKAFNKIISEGIKKKLDEAKGLWADELPNVLWPIRTTAKNSTSETHSC